MAEGQKTKSKPSGSSRGGSGPDFQINQSESAKSSMTPDFLKASESNPGKPANSFIANPGEEGDAARAGEEDVETDKAAQKEAEYRNKVKGKKEAMKAVAGGAGGAAKFVAKNGLKGTAKKAGPIGTIIIIMVMFMGASFGGQSNMLFGLVSRMGTFDPVDLANSTRSRVLMKSMMRGNNTKGGVWSKLSDKIKKKLGIAGIDVEEDADGSTKLKTETETGEIKTTTADTLDNDIATDNKFLTQYTDGTASVNNSVHSNYGEEAEVLYDGVHVKRGDLNDIRADDDYEPAKASFDEKVESDMDSVSGRVSAEFDEPSKKQKQDMGPDGKTPQYDSDGNPIMVDTDDVETSAGRINLDENIDADSMRTQIEGAVEGKADPGDAVGKGSKIANGLCQAYNVISGISRAIKALELAQVIVVAFKVFQAIQRMQAGDGGADVLVDVVGTYLVTEKTTTFDFGSSYDPVTLTGSAMSSTPIASLFGGAMLTQGDPIVRSFLITDNDFQNFFKGFGNSAGGYRTCIGVQLAAGFVDLIGDIASFFTFGLAKIGQWLVKIGKSAILSGAIALAVALIVPIAIKAFTREFGDLLTGPESSGALVWGGSYVQERLGQMFGFRPATDESWATYAVERSKLIAERARYDRATKSPFDTTSEYTFLGTIMSNINTMTLQTSSLLGKAGNIMSVVGKSFLALTPASHATDATDAMVSEGACALNDINSVNGGGKMYCNAFEVAWNVPDFETMGTGPEEVMEYWQNHVNQRVGTDSNPGSFVDDYDPVTNPNPAIRENTDLALHIEEYNNRGSELNVADSEIEAKYGPVTTGSGVADAVIGVIPVVGSVIDIFNNGVKALHVNQILGSQYTEESVENDMAERYSQDQDMGVAFGVYDQSQTAVYMKKYYEKHPLDNSLEGVVAHLSGLSKERVAEAFDYVETYTFLAQYEPSGLGPTVINEPESDKIYIEDDQISGDTFAVINQNNYYYRKDQYITA